MTREEMRYKLNELRMMLNDGKHGEEQGILVNIISEMDKWEEIPICPISDLSENKGDLISRQALIAEFADMRDGYPIITDSQLTVKDVISTILSIPSVENKGEWIPVSERMPEDGAWAIFTDGKSISVERFKLDAEDHFFPNGRWFELDEAIAWQPLPEPYKAESEEMGEVFGV